MTPKTFFLTSAAVCLSATAGFAASDDASQASVIVGDYDGILIERSTEETASDDVLDQIGQTEKEQPYSPTEPDTILAAATQGTEVQSVKGETIGHVHSVLKSERDMVSRYIVVEVSDGADLGAEEIGFEIDALSVSDTGELEYSDTLVHLRQQVAELKQMAQ